MTSLRGLEILGISVLTGERDNTMTGRLLCDLNQDGVSLVTRYFGLPQHNPIAHLESNWNREVNGKPAVSSIMLPSILFPELAVFGLITMPGVEFVYANQYHIWSDDDTTWNRIDLAWSEAMIEAEKTIGRDDIRFSRTAANLVPSYLQDVKRWKGLGGLTVNQVHAMSGRR